MKPIFWIGAGLLLGSAVRLSLAVTAIAAPVSPYGAMNKDGIGEDVTTASETLLSARSNRQAFCIIADPDNTDTVHLRFAAAAATTSYLEVDANGSYCEPVGGDQVYSGEVRAIAGAGTQRVYLIEY